MGDLQQLLSAVRSARKSPINDPSLGAMLKANTYTSATSAVSGITAYDLEGPAKLVYPVITPLRNQTPRTSGKGGIQANWRAITQINTANMEVGVSEGQRGGVIGVTEQDFFAAYRTLGLEGSATMESEFAAEGFDDVRALAAMQTLESVMIGEEQTIIGGNMNVQLGTTPTPNLAQATTGGALSNATYYITCVALSYGGLQTGTVSAQGVRGLVTRVNAGPYASSSTYGGGAAAPSAETSIAVNGGGSTQSITASLTTPVPAAFGYAWYISTTSGQERIVAITTYSTVTIGALPAGTNQLSSTLVGDNSTNNLVYNGLFSLAFAAGSNAYLSAVNGTLTSNSAGGVTQIDTALQSFWNNYRLSPTDMWCNGQEVQNITNKVLGNAASGAQRFNVMLPDQAKVAGGFLVTEYRNKFAMGGATTLKINIHPYVPAGAILFTTSRLPYPLSNVSNVMQIRNRRDYYQIQWPLITRQYEYGVYIDTVFQHFFPPSIGVLYNILNG
jgi:hypothetical protein